MDITKIRREMPCVIIPDAYKDRKYHGHVMWLDPLANYSKGSVQVKVRIENPDDYLRVEGSARVDFLAEEPDVSDEGKSTIWLPKSAVLIESPPSGGVVMTYDDERLERQTVTVGRQDDRLAEITAGLTPGMRVADEPGKYQDGQRVKLPGA
jgi:HlyD family secretion protein